MTITVTIRCDAGRNNRIPRSRACYSDKGRASQNAEGESFAIEPAKRLAELAANQNGWVKKRMPGRTPSVAWVCPSCKAALE